MNGEYSETFNDDLENCSKLAFSDINVGVNATNEELDLDRKFKN